MNRYRIDIEYDGTAYCGWQKQNDAQEASSKKSIQSAIEEALFRYCQEDITLTVAGRTDAGVHAMHQVAHFDMQKQPKNSASEIALALRYHLGVAKENITILSSQKVNNNFSARFDAKKRHYLYRIILRKAPLALDATRAWQISYPLDIENMRHAAKLLLGKHDFTSFRSSQCQAKNPIRTLDNIDFELQGDNLYIKVSAQSFLHNQVRAMVGTLYNVGRGFWQAEYINEILQAKSRCKAGPNAPAHGLYLYKIEY